MALKILVAALAVLIVLAILVSPDGVDKAKGFFNDVKVWVGVNAGGITSTPAGTKTVSISLDPQAPFVISPDVPVNITSGSVHINGFSGGLNASSDGVVLSEPATGLVMSLPANGTVIEGLKLSSLAFGKIGFYISPNITATEGNITITGFYGTGSIDDGKLSLEGNVTKVKATIGAVAVEV
jgi:hypothetical protein